MQTAQQLRVATDEDFFLAERLCLARMLAHMSYAEAAVALSKSENTIRAYESGRIQPRVHVLRDLARVYGCTVSHLLGEDNAA